MHRVELFPSGRHFIVEPGQTILEAALTAGVTVPYLCANGSCGDCRARIIEGIVGETAHHDFVFTGTDRQHPMLLMCMSQPASDMIIETALPIGNEDIPHQRITTTVKTMQRIREEVLILTLRTPRSKTLRFLAGQQVTLRVPKAGETNRNIASCPCNGLELQFHFRLEPGDGFSDYLFKELKPQDTVEVEGPFGELMFDDESTRPVLLIAYDTGFAAMKSLFEHIISLETEQPVHLYWMVPGEGHAYLVNQCRAWADALGNFRYTELFTMDAATVYATIADQYDNLKEHDIYICAPGAFSRELKDLLEGGGLPVNRIQTEYV